jgi:putative transposase
VIGRPNLTILIDSFSRMVVGYFISTTPVNRRSVLKAIIHSVLPKDYITKKYPDLTNEWPCFGIYSQLVSDNGMDLLAHDVKSALLKLGIDYTQHGKKTPKDKGKVERFFRTLNEQLLGSLPGKTFSNHYKKGDYKAVENACFTLEDVDAFIHSWIVDIYHVTVHETLRDTPLNVWKKSIKNFQAPRLPANAYILQEILMETEERRLQKYGLDLFDLKYNSEGLMKIARKKGFKVPLKVLYDPDNIATITVLDPDDNSPVEAMCVNVGYANGFLPLDVHKAAQATAREAAGRKGNLAEKELIRARAKLDADVANRRANNQKTLKKKSRLHKGDVEMKQTSGSINGTDKARHENVTRIFDDTVVRQQLKTKTFLPF